MLKYRRYLESFLRSGYSGHFRQQHVPESIRAEESGKKMTITVFVGENDPLCRSYHWKVGISNGFYHPNTIDSRVDPAEKNIAKTNRLLYARNFTASSNLWYAVIESRHAPTKICCSTYWFDKQRLLMQVFQLALLPIVSESTEAKFWL